MHPSLATSSWNCPAEHCPQLVLPPAPCFHPAGQPLQESWRCELASWKKPVPQLPQTTLAVVEHTLVRLAPAPHVVHDLHAAFPDWSM